MNGNTTHAGNSRSTGELLRGAAALLRRSGSATPRLDAEVLLAHVTGLSREALLTHPALTPTPEVIASFDWAVARRADRCPVAYITGRREFMSLTLEVNPDVLIPRPETELLVEVAARLLSAAGPAGLTEDSIRTGDVTDRANVVVDVGTGSGAVAVALAHLLPEIAIIATDISPSALAVARRNAAGLGLAARIDFRQGDLLEPVHSLSPRGVVANLPYVPDAEWEKLPAGVRDFEPAVSLRGGADGLELLRRLTAGLPSCLAPGGFVALEVGAGQAPAVSEMLMTTSLFAGVTRHRDLLGHQRVVSARGFGLVGRTQ